MLALMHQEDTYVSLAARTKHSGGQGIDIKMVQGAKVHCMVSER